MHPRRRVWVPRRPSGWAQGSSAARKIGTDQPRKRRKSAELGGTWPAGKLGLLYAAVGNTDVMDSPERAARITAVVDELTNARRRGLDDLELAARNQRPVPTPQLERLARAYSGEELAPRIPLIRRLLDDGLTAWKQRGHDDEADFVRRLFFDTQGGGTPGKRRPGALLDELRREQGLADELFDDRRRTYFERFAAFLLDFVPAPRGVGEASRRRRLRRQWLTGGAVGLAMLAVVVAVVVATHRGGGSPATSPSPSDTTSTATSSGDTTSSRPTATLTFDALGGRTSKIIRVFPGVGTSARDRTANGTFTDGDKVTAICKTTGRTVKSHVAGGEQPRRSNVWVRIQGSPGLAQYATLTFGDIDRAALGVLPQC
jgi:hypothetical protein